MKIDTLIREITVKNHPLYSGVRYCAAFTDCIEGTIGDPYSGKLTYDWENAFSVLWTEETLADFLPSKGVHEMVYAWRESIQRKIEYSKNYIKTKPKYYTNKRTGEVLNMHEIEEGQIEFYENHRLDFIKINFVSE